MSGPQTPVVVIVDDDESLRHSVRNLLMSVGFRVETFSSAEAFLQSDRRDRTGCLVVDLRMGGMSGIDLLASLAAADVRIPAIVLTAHGDDESRRRSVAAGAVAFLGKPFHGDALLDAVRRTLQPAACGGR